MRNNYEELVFSATELCSKWGIPITKENKRKKFAKRQYDSIDNDKRLDEVKGNFRITVFYLLLILQYFNYKSVLKDFKQCQVILTFHNHNI